MKIKPLAIERERLNADVLIAGAGPPGLTCAVSLSRLFGEHNRTCRTPELSPENVQVPEKGRELGAHQLSGATMGPRALLEWLPRFEKLAPLESWRKAHRL